MNWTGLEKTEAPLALAVKLSFVKEYLRIDTTNEDSFLKTLIKAATTSVEEHLERSLLTTSWKYTLDNFTKRFDSRRESYNTEGVVESTRNEVYNEVNFIYLPMGKVQSITNLITYNDGNVATTFLSSRYYLDSVNDKSRLVLNDQETWPTDLRLNSAIEINYVSGFGDSSNDVPEDIKLAITMIISNMYENRCEPKISGAVKSMLSKYKIYSLG